MYQYNPLLSILKESRVTTTNTKKQSGTKENILAGTAGQVGATLASVATFMPLAGKMNMKKNNGIDLSSIIGNKGEALPSYLNGLKVNGKQDISSYLKDKGIKLTTKSNQMGAVFDPATNTIHLPINKKYQDKYGKALFAHELGHSVKMGLGKSNNPLSNKRMVAYHASKGVTSTVAFAQMLNCFRGDDESRQKLGKALSVAGGVSALPMIAEEIGASMRGTKMLGLKGMNRARAFFGVGTYVALALSPTIMYQVSERTRKFLRSLKKIKQDDPVVEKKLNKLKKEDTKVKV